MLGGVRWYYPFLLGFLVAVVFNVCLANNSEVCETRGSANLYLDLATTMINYAKDSCIMCRPMDCEDWRRCGRSVSGVYPIWPRSRMNISCSIYVYCDMETDGGGWTVIQRRGNYGHPKDYFYRNWESYKNGFGNIREDFWLGNDKIFALTNQRSCSARFDLADVEGNEGYAQYENFWIDDEDHQYDLHIGEYSGNVGDSMLEHNNQKFSTKDRKNDNAPDISCAEVYKGGWWYNRCHASNLNGLYHRGKHDSFADGVNWYTWRGHHESLDKTEIKIRSNNFRKAE